MKIGLLSVIVPVYKQEKTIKKDLSRIYETLSATPYDFEIIAAVDGTSLDASLDRIKELKLPKLTVIGYVKNKGKGQAVRYGMKHANGDVVTFIDAGMDIDPSGIIMLLEHMSWYDADIIIGSKLHPASRVSGYPAFRRLYTYGYYFLVKLLFGLSTRDTQTGLKAFKRPVLEKVLDRLVVKKFAFDVEILSVAKNLGFTRIYDAPVLVDFDTSNTNFSRVFPFSIIMDFVKDTLAVWYRMYVLNYYHDDVEREKTYDSDLKLYINTGEISSGHRPLGVKVTKFKDTLISIYKRFIKIVY